MLKLLKSAGSIGVVDAGGSFHIQIATIMRLKLPPNYDHVAYPERRKLRAMPKATMIDDSFGFVKMPKMLNLMRGPEPVHNRIAFGEYAVQAVGGGRLTFRHMESIRTVIFRKMNDKIMFAEWRVPPPWQSVTKKGIGIRMGSGKGKIDKHVTPIRPDRIILEFGGECEYEEVLGIMTRIRHILPFESRVISRKMVEEEEQRLKELEKTNMNPFTYEEATNINLMGIDKYLSPYDYKWHGKYR